MNTIGWVGGQGLGTHSAGPYMPEPNGLTFRTTWTPKVCKIIAFVAVILGLGLLFYILLGFR